MSGLKGTLRGIQNGVDTGRRNGAGIWEIVELSDRVRRC